MDGDTGSGWADFEFDLIGPLVTQVRKRMDLVEPTITRTNGYASVSSSGGRKRTHLRQPQIQWMLNPTGNIHFFTRSDNRTPFEFQGWLEPIEAEDSTPVKIRWRVLKNPPGATPLAVDVQHPGFEFLCEP